MKSIGRGAAFMYNPHLDTFLIVANTGSFSKAAEKLFISHTAVIKQINVLRKHGYDPLDWTFEQASKKIGQLASVGWQRWRLHE